MTVALVMTWNGRDCVHEVAASLVEHLTGPIGFVVFVNDSDQPFPEVDLPYAPSAASIAHGQNKGLAAAVNSGWAKALSEPDVTYVLHWEDDMRLDAPLDLTDLVRVLERHPTLAQIVVQRHPVNHVEAEGQLKAIIANAGYSHIDPVEGYTAHDALFSLNPCLIPRRVVEMGWPSGPIGVGNEDGMTAKCREAGYEFGVWGTLDGPVLVTHVGHERAPGWRL